MLRSLLILCWFRPVRSFGEFIVQWARYVQWRGALLEEYAMNELERDVLEQNIAFDREWRKEISEQSDKKALENGWASKEDIERLRRQPHESQYRLGLKNVSFSRKRPPMVIRDKWYLPRRPFSGIEYPQ